MFRMGIGFYIDTDRGSHEPNEPTLCFQGPKQGRIPEIMLCRVLMFDLVLWPRPLLRGAPGGKFKGKGVQQNSFVRLSRG